MWNFIANWFVKITGWLAYLIIFRPKTYFENRKIQGRKIKKSAIVVSNHNSLYDFAMMLFLFPFRTLRCVVAELMFEKNAFMTFFLKATGAIKVDRNSHDFAFIDKSREILEKGGVVEIYPESRLPNEGEETPLPFKPSTVYIALTSGAPIIPIYCNGKYFCKERLVSIVGTPFYASDYYDDNLTEDENVKNITEILRNRILELKDELKKQENK